MSFTNRIGLDNFTWWLGVVEDRQDPLNLGRVRVRIFGWHTADKTLIPTSSLPWAQPMVPINATLLTGTAQEGDFAFGFFMDGQSGQAPCIMGVFPGIPQEFANNSKGFTDSRDDATLQNSPKRPTINGSSWSEGTPKLNPTVLGEPTTSRVSRNENIEETLIGFRKNTLVENIPLPLNDTWSEPATEYSPAAPYNRVLDTESGHLMEFDDTPGKERVNITHRKGSFVEFHPDGSKVTKVVGNNYELLLQGQNVYVKGECNISVDGSVNLFVSGDVNEQINGNVNSLVKGDLTATINGTMLQTIDEEIQITSPVIKLNGDTQIEGTLYVSDQITGGADIVAGNGVSVETHLHDGVSRGTAATNPPVS